MSEFVQGNLNTKEQVSCMLILIQKKLGMSVEQASDFMRNTIGINLLNIQSWQQRRLMKRKH